MSETNDKGIKATGFAALALAFASFGDAFLYPFLPVNFESVGVPVMWVGLLLSINRFVRIVSNTIIIHAFARYGLRSIMIVAVALAITSTLGYGIATGLLAWLLFRVMWGLAFSAMRIGTLGYALQHNKKGFALGISRSLQESGPMIALFIAPVLLNSIESKTIFFVLALMSIPALYFVLSLPGGEDKIQGLETTYFIGWPSALNSITLVSAILIDGIIVVVLGVLFLHYRESISLVTATTLAAFYLGYRKVCLVALSPAGGWIADRVGLDRIFNISITFVALGLVIILCGWIGTGVVIVFTFYSINAAITPGSVTKGNASSLAAAAENATWRDIGAAMGTLTGGFLISSQHLNTVIAVVIFVLIFLLFIHLGAARKAIKLLYLWK
jgi:DHA1 family multidrug resistance protein-like MFS transporter